MMTINAVMAILYGYFYFAFFTAMLIGRIRSTAGFYIMYGIHIGITVGSIIGGFFINTTLYVEQIPYMVLVVFGAILGPFYLYSRKQNTELEGQLQSANERISELSVYEERQRIARDLHDTLGQKLSMIGLKLDLAIRLVDQKPAQAKQELKEVRQTTSLALKEVREMVSDMKKVKLSDELIQVEELLRVANIDSSLKGTYKLKDVPLIVENTLSMCLKEAINNVVRHSEATACTIVVSQTSKEVQLTITDNGKGLPPSVDQASGNGLKGMKERVEFVNGKLTIDTTTKGTTLTFTVPLVIVYQEG
uniref:sensor histidine kinase n=1 Tax=Kurthia senegalensis TaxID=1033740 RepID=UPI00028935F1|nr:sensor histidine kinase [Kurthia senegalensis]